MNDDLSSAPCPHIVLILLPRLCVLILLPKIIASWCGPCRMAAPQFEAMAQRYSDCTFAKVVEDNSKDLIASEGKFNTTLFDDDDHAVRQSYGVGKIPFSQSYMYIQAFKLSLPSVSISTLSYWKSSVVQTCKLLKLPSSSTKPLSNLSSLVLALVLVPVVPPTQTKTHVLLGLDALAYLLMMCPHALLILVLLLQHLHQPLLQYRNLWKLDR